MRHARDHATPPLFDPFVHVGPKRRRMLDQSWAGLFRTEVLPHLPVGRLAAAFAAARGRPTKDLFVALGALALQGVFDLTDPQAERAVAFDLQWHYALDITDESQACLSERTVRNYRQRLIELGLDKALFETITVHLARVFGVDCSRQRIDSTALRSAMRKLSRLGIFVQTIRQFLRQLGQAFPQDLQDLAALDAPLCQRYLEDKAEGKEGGCFGACKPSEASGQLQTAAQDLLRLVDRFAGTPAADLEGYQLLCRVLDEQCDIPSPKAGDHQGGRMAVVKEQESVSGDSLQNPSDPDCTHNGHKGQGFTMQVMETYQEHAPAAAGDAPGEPSAEPRTPDLITAVSINPMTTHDGHTLAATLDDAAARDLGPSQVLGDTHYGVGDNPQQARQRGVELIAPAQPPKAYLQGKLSLEHFELDERGQVVRCPAGHGPLANSASVKNFQAKFDQHLCHTCPLRPNCPVQRPRGDGTMRLQYDAARLAMFRRRKSEQQESFTGRYRWRAGIEGTMSRLKHWMGLGMLRVRGLAAVTYHAVLAALGLNILRCAACHAAP